MEQTASVQDQGNQSIPKRKIFKTLNYPGRPTPHSVNKLIFDDRGNIAAVGCNCGKHMFHPVINDKVVIWYDTVEVRK